MNRKFYGIEVSNYAEKEGFVDYLTLSKATGGVILCNNIENRLFNTLEIENGSLFNHYDEEGNEVAETEEYETEEQKEIFQWYIISDSGKDTLQYHCPDELIFYDSELDIYVWGITHYGTSWDYVLTNIELKD